MRIQKLSGAKIAAKLPVETLELGELMKMNAETLGKAVKEELKRMEDNELKKRLEKMILDEYIEERELRKQISELSVKNVALEGTAIYCTTLALAWYLFQW